MCVCVNTYVGEHMAACVCVCVCVHARTRVSVCVILGSVLTVRTLKRNLHHYFLRGRKRRYKGKERKGCRRDEWSLSGEQGQCDVETGVSVGEKYARARVCVCVRTHGRNQQYYCTWRVVFVHIFYVWLHVVTPQLCWIIAILLARGTVCSCNCSARVVMFSDDSVRSYSGGKVRVWTGAQCLLPTSQGFTSCLGKYPKHWQGRRFANTDNVTILLYGAAFHFISDIFFALCLFFSIRVQLFWTTPIPEVNIASIHSMDTLENHYIKSF